MWTAFVEKHTDINGVYSGGLSRTDFLKTIGCATNRQQKTYAALDQIKVQWSIMFTAFILKTFYYCNVWQVRCGTENFKKGRVLLQALIAMHPSLFTGYEQYLAPLLEKYEEHCKTGLPNHLSHSSKTACHCVRHLFGGQQHFSTPCGPECNGHLDNCKDCDAGRVFVHILRYVRCISQC